MAEKRRTLTQRINDLADELEKKFPKITPSKPRETATDALDRLEDIVKELVK